MFILLRYFNGTLKFKIFILIHAEKHFALKEAWAVIYQKLNGSKTHIHSSILFWDNQRKLYDTPRYYLF